MPIDTLPPVHPGIFLREEMETLQISARTFAAHNAITGIMNGQRAITAQMAIRLSRAFGTTPQYWLNLQTIHDLKRAQIEIGDIAATIVPWTQTVAPNRSPGQG